MPNLTPEQRLKLMVECRQAERILKHFWLKHRVAEVRKLMVEMEAELAALEGELHERRPKWCVRPVGRERAAAR